MSEANETKQGKLDIISSLQMKQSQTVDKKKEDELEEGWSDYSEDEDYPQTNKVNDASAVVKVEDKSKKYSNLKEVFGENSGNQNRAHHHKGGHFGNKNKKKQGGTFYKEKDREQKNPNEFSRPVFTSSYKGGNNNNGVNTNPGVSMNNPSANTEIYNFKNTNQEYTKKTYTNNYNDRERNDRRQNNNYNNNYRDRDNYNNNRNYTKPYDEKENVMKSIHNFGNIVKNVAEDNNRVKAPLKNYTDVDLTKDKYKTKEEIQRPQFINSTLESKPSNFKELNHEGDLYLKKIQETGLENMVEYYQKTPKGEFKKKGHGTHWEGKANQEAQGDENPEGRENYSNNNSHNENLQQEGEDLNKVEKDFNNLNVDDNSYEGRGYYKNKKFRGGNYYPKYHHNTNDYWSIVDNKTGEGDYHQSENISGYTKKDYHTENKPKKVIRREEAPKKNEALTTPSNPAKDKVVVSVSNAKSIKELFG